MFSENRLEICGLDSCSSGKESVAGSCEHVNETSGSIKGWEVTISLSRRTLLHGVRLYHNDANNTRVYPNVSGLSR
jgi:hypothetical protein